MNLENAPSTLIFSLQANLWKSSGTAREAVKLTALTISNQIVARVAPVGMEIGRQE